MKPKIWTYGHEGNATCLRCGSFKDTWTNRFGHGEIDILQTSCKACGFGIAVWSNGRTEARKRTRPGDPILDVDGEGTWKEIPQGALLVVTSEELCQ